MAAPLYLTKGELRSKLLTRLGYGGLGAAAGMFVPIADDLLEEAQDILFQVFTDEKGVREWTLSTAVAQRWYDIPTTCDADKIMGMWAQESASDDWIGLKRGINAAHDSVYDDTEERPYRFDLRYNPLTTKPQIEIWPKPDAVYPMKIEGKMEVSAFVADGHRASFPTRLILLYAVAYGKLHLNKPDAKAAMDAWTTFLKAHKASQHGNRKYIRRNPNRPVREVRARPKVV